MQMEHIRLKITVTLKALKNMNFQALYFIQSCFLDNDVLPRCTASRRISGQKRVYSVPRLSHKTTNQFVIFLKS